MTAPHACSSLLNHPCLHRSVVAQEVSSDPEAYNSGFLGERVEGWGRAREAQEGAFAWVALRWCTLLASMRHNAHMSTPTAHRSMPHMHTRVTPLRRHVQCGVLQLDHEPRELGGRHRAGHPGTVGARWGCGRLGCKRCASGG